MAVVIAIRNMSWPWTFKPKDNIHLMEAVANRVAEYVCQHTYRSGVSEEARQAFLRILKEKGLPDELMERAKEIWKKCYQAKGDEFCEPPDFNKPYCIVDRKYSFCLGDRNTGSWLCPRQVLLRGGVVKGLSLVEKFLMLDRSKVIQTAWLIPGLQTDYIPSEPTRLELSEKEFEGLLERMKYPEGPYEPEEVEKYLTYAEKFQISAIEEGIFIWFEKNRGQLSPEVATRVANILLRKAMKPCRLLIDFNDVLASSPRVVATATELVLPAEVDNGWLRLLHRFPQLRSLDMSESKIGLGKTTLSLIREQAPHLNSFKLGSWSLREGSFTEIAQLQQVCSLDFSRIIVTTEGIRLLAGMPALTSLRLGVSVKDDVLRALPPRLEELDLRNCIYLTDLDPLRGLPLRRLDISECHNVTSGLGAVSAIPTLRELDLSSCYALDLSDLTAPYLTVFRLNGLHQLTDKILDGLLSRVGATLELLDLSGCTQLTDRAIESVAKHCPRLKTLNIANCPLITNRGLEHAATIRTLTTFNARVCPLLTDDGVKAFRGSQVEDFNFTGCSELTDAGLSYLVGLPVHRLILTRCGKVTDEGVKILSSIPSLRILSLYGCSEVTEGSIKHLLKMDLEGLDLGESGIQGPRFEGIFPAPIREALPWLGFAS